MKQFVQKIIQQLETDGKKSNRKTDIPDTELNVNEAHATILFMLDVFSKHLFEVENYPVRRTREILDNYIKQLVDPEKKSFDQVLFRLRQFYSAYRVNEYTYIQKNFEEFKGIIWDFVDQLSEEFSAEEISDVEIQSSLSDLKDAVEANSLDLLRTKSREFIDNYIEHQTRKEDRKVKRISAIKKNLDFVKQQLVEANKSMRVDHLTQAFNRRSFDERLKQHWQLFQVSRQPVTLLSLDIDHFKKVNDNWGHDVGDFVLVECVKLLKEVCSRDADFVSRVGGEEFTIILPDYNAEQAFRKAEELHARIRKETYVKQEMELKFTISVGLAQLEAGESLETWLKRADTALYTSKQTGRNRTTISHESADKKTA